MKECLVSEILQICGFGVPRSARSFFLCRAGRVAVIAVSLSLSLSAILERSY